MYSPLFFFVLRNYDLRYEDRNCPVPFFAQGFGAQLLASSEQVLNLTIPFLFVWPWRSRSRILSNSFLPSESQSHTTVDIFFHDSMQKLKSANVFPLGCIGMCLVLMLPLRNWVSWARHLVPHRLLALVYKDSQENGWNWSVVNLTK